MALVVLGEESLDTLEQLVRDRFTEIPNRQLPSSVTELSLFDMERLPLWCNPSQQQNRGGSRFYSRS